MIQGEKFNYVPAHDRLLALISHLQSDMNGAAGRRALLHYLRQRSGARLAALFLLDETRSELTLLDQSGQRPPLTASTTGHRLSPKHLPLNGLFGSALNTSGLIHIPDLYADQRTLPQEQRWGWPGGQILLSAVKTSSGGAESKQGVVVLSFSEGEQALEEDADQESDILVGIILLSLYLSDLPDQLDPSLPEPLFPLSPFSPTAPAPIAPEPKKTRPVRRPRRNVPARAPKSQRTRASEPQPSSFSQSETTDQNRIFSFLLEEAINQERQRIARDLHDGPAQQLAHVLHKLEFIQSAYEKYQLSASPSSSQRMILRELHQSRHLLAASIEDLRATIFSPVPQAIEERGFPAAVQSLIADQRTLQPTLHMDYSIDDFALVPSSLELPVFRLIQETLNNIVKHAQASVVTLSIRRTSTQLVVELSDNGSGMAVEENRQAGEKQENDRKRPNKKGSESRNGNREQQGAGLGLRSMRERIRQAGGSWEIKSKPGRGTTIVARFPLTTPALTLTSREHEVLLLVVEGLTNRDIAERLSISVETVKSHLHHIMQKMQVKDRTQAAVVATRQGLL